MIRDKIALLVKSFRESQLLNYGRKLTPTEAAKEQLANGHIYFYEMGYTTPKNAYADEELTTLHRNPIIADSEGVFPDVFRDQNEAYSVDVYNSDDEALLMYEWPANQQQRLIS